MRFLPLSVTALALLCATPVRAADDPGGEQGKDAGLTIQSAQQGAPSQEGQVPDEIHAVQKRPLKSAKRLELWPYASISIADPWLTRVGGGLRAMWHLREGLSAGFDGMAGTSFETEELVIARRELHARLLDSRQLGAFQAVASVAPVVGKVALPGDALVHFEIFADAGLGAALTETDSGRGVRPLVSGGIGHRLLLGDSTALLLRVGGQLWAERMLINGDPVTKAAGYWNVQLGLSFYFPRRSSP